MSLFLFDMSWRIIYIESSDHLSLYLDNLKIKNGLDETTIPLSDINSIVIDNYSTTITVGLINKCMEYKINLITCNLFHLPNGLILPFCGNYQTPAIFYQQIHWNTAFLKIIWQIIVKAKIINQRKILIINQKSKDIIKKLEQYIEEVTPDDVTNREGLSAKIYFRELFGNTFLRFHNDNINAALNYGYSILRSQICRTLVAKGLSPQLGIKHSGASNPFNLADDLIEPFRPIIDNYVYQNIIPNSSFTRENRLSIVELMTKKVSYKDQKITIINAIYHVIDNLINMNETGETDILVFPDVIVYDL